MSEAIPPVAAGPGGDQWQVGADSAPGGRRRPVRWMVATAVAVLVAVVLSVVLADVAAERDTLQDRLSDRRQVALVAGELTTALFTIDGGDLEATRDRVLELSTGRLEAEFEEFVTGAVGSAFAELRATSTAVVSDVFVGDVDGDSAQAVVVMDQTVDRGEGAEEYFDRYLVLTLVRTPAGWRVDGVLTIQGSAAPAAGSSAPLG